MPVSYSDLKTVDDEVVEQTLQPSWEVDKDKHRGFIHFENRPLQLKLPETASLDKCWRFHLSVAPESLASAWALLSDPILAASISFKVTHDEEIASVRDFAQAEFLNCAAKLKKLAEIKDDHNGHRDEIQTIFDELYDTIEDPAEEALWDQYDPENNDDLTATYNFLLPRLLAALPELREDLKSHLRMAEGMQFTFYIPEGEELFTTLLAERAELLLYEAGIKPGKIDGSDEKMGAYVSRRHPGLTRYHDALEVDSYNPENAPDPFTPLIGLAVVNEIEQLTRYKQQLNEATDSALKESLLPKTEKLLAGLTAIKETLLTSKLREVIDYQSLRQQFFELKQESGELTLANKQSGVSVDVEHIKPSQR